MSLEIRFEPHCYDCHEVDPVIDMGERPTLGAIRRGETNREIIIKCRHIDRCRYFRKKWGVVGSENEEHET